MSYWCASRCSWGVLPLMLSAIVASACGHRHPAGRMAYTEVQSRSEGRSMRYGLYTPAGWDGQTPLPLVVLLHGSGDDETSADRKVVTDKLDEAIESGQVPPLLMVTPQGDRGFWMNWYDESHRYRDWVMEEVIPQVRREAPIIEGAAGLHLMGVSMGGGGGMQMWLRDRSRFASATILSAPIFNEDETRDFLRRYLPNKIMERVFGPPGSNQGVDPYQALQEAEDLEGSRLLFGAASRDYPPMRSSNERFARHLAQADVPYRYVEFTGRHGWQAWSDIFVFALCHQLQPTCGLAAPSAWTVVASP